MEERTEMDSELRKLCDEHLRLRQEAEVFKTLYQQFVEKLLKIDRQLAEAMETEFNSEIPLIFYTIEEKAQKRNESDQDVRYTICNILPEKDAHGASMYVSCRVHVLSREERLLRIFQEVAKQKAQREQESKNEKTDQN